ncbi:MAG: PepSY-associated TM helix domain-containing protein [Bryobacteraceae bacterium]|nr:PepSY-associated TM helix domain-containing protein [Bryobacteraceae bacterium]
MNPVFRRSPAASSRPAPARPGWKARLWQQLRLWHWVSSALSLAGMLLFAFTGVTLNHAGSITARPRVQVREAVAPQAVRLALLEDSPASRELAAAWFRQSLGFRLERAQLERQGSELMASLPSPGGDTWLTVDLDSGAVHMERTDRGWIAYLNDLHKGRHTGRAWSVFLDVFAAACAVFCLTGLGLLALHAPRRPMTWPAAVAGLLLPALVALWFIHR